MRRQSDSSLECTVDILIHTNGGRCISVNLELLTLHMGSAKNRSSKNLKCKQQIARLLDMKT